MKIAMLILAAVNLSGLWQQATQPSNPKAATERGIAAYQRQQYSQAATEFAVAASSESSPQRLFNLGTAQIAAGERVEGAATLAKAMENESLRAAAHFNRGNSALAAKAWEHAVRDYTEALKIAPGDAAAKRNLEIALRRQQSDRQQQQSGGQQNQPQAPAPQDQPDPQQSPDRGRQEKGEADAEALLRSVQQQEQEELARMKRARGESRRVGW